MWQALNDDLRALNFKVLAVALDTTDAARPWIEAAGAQTTALLDPEHRLAAPYNFVNVPEAAWIDETGRIVRPPETAGAYEAFRYRDARTGAPPADEAAKRDRARQVYYDAVRDWARLGAASRFAMTEAEARAHIARPSAASAEAHVRFRIGVELLAQGREAEAAERFAEASRLHPDSWAIWRQAAPRNAQGFAADDSFWTRVAALGDRRYYPPPPMPGMP